MWQSLVAHASNALVNVVDPVTMQSVQVEEKRPAGSSSVGCGAIGGDRGDVEVGHPLCFAPIGCIFLQVHQTHCNQQL